MNVETNELTAVDETCKIEECSDILALSPEDLDLVGGGTLGLLY